MQGLIAGMNSMVKWGQKIGAAGVVLALVVLGVSTILGGAEGKAKFKEVMKTIILGCVVCFGASTLGKALFNWFS